MRVTFTDARRGAKAADLCDGCAGTMPGNAVARRGASRSPPRRLARSAGGAPRRSLFPHFAATRSHVRKLLEGPDYDGQMGLSLVVGPAHAGKVALLLDRFVDALDRDPWLIVPNRVDVDRVERELAGRLRSAARRNVGTFDTLFAHLAGNGSAPRTLGESERGVVLRHIVATARLDVLRPVIAIRRFRGCSCRRADRDRGGRCSTRRISDPIWRP